MKKKVKTSFLKLKGDLILKQLNRTPRVLFWHGVDNIIDKEVEAESFDIETFQKQIDYLAKNFEIISIEEFYLRFKEDRFSKREVVLTFDDGYANNLYEVAPILNKRSIPFMVFISTEHIETGALYPTSVARLILLGDGLNRISIPSIDIEDADISSETLKRSIYLQVSKELKNRPVDEVKKIVEELIGNLSELQYDALKAKYKSVIPMNWEEVVKLHQLGATIGSHCQYHICCHENQSPDEVKKQIIESKQTIEDKLKVECKYFAYPNGDYTDISNSFVREAGYTLGFSTEKHNRITIDADVTTIPRIGVPLNIDTFKLFVNLYPKR